MKFFSINILLILAGLALSVFTIVSVISEVTNQNKTLVETTNDQTGAALEKSIVSTQFNSDFFINWTAAIFAVLAVAFALFVLLLAIKGWSEFSKILEEINTKVETKLQVEVTKVTDTIFKEKFAPALSALFSDKQLETVKTLNLIIADELDKAKKKLDDEIKVLIRKDDFRHQVVDLAVEEVRRRLAPPTHESNQNEFEPGKGH